MEMKVKSQNVKMRLQVVRWVAENESEVSGCDVVG